MVGAVTSCNSIRRQGEQLCEFDGVVWSWHYKSMNTRRLLYIYIDPQGVVARYHTGDDFEFERLPW